MLVVLVIIVTLVALAAGAMRRSPADRINGSARLLQSQVLLARSIAARDQRVSGIRLVQSANDPWVVDSVQLIASPGYDTGTAAVDSAGANGPWRVTNDTPNEWLRLVQRGLIRNGSRMELPAGTGRWYQLQNVTGTDIVELVGHYTPSVWDSSASNYVAQPATNVNYRLELAPTVTAGEEPLRLQPGTAIDLAACDNVPPTLEILFAPGQGLTGDSARDGNIFLYITTLEDIELTRNMLSPHPGDGPLDLSLIALPIVPANPPSVPKTEPAALAIYAQTGNVLSVPVNLNVASPPPYEADNPYVDARRGKELGR